MYGREGGRIGKSTRQKDYKKKKKKERKEERNCKMVEGSGYVECKCGPLKAGRCSK